VVNPFLSRCGARWASSAFSLPGRKTRFGKKLLPLIHGQPTESSASREELRLAAKLKNFAYRARRSPPSCRSRRAAGPGLFQKFPGLDANAKFNNAGFWTCRFRW